MIDGTDPRQAKVVLLSHSARLGGAELVLVEAVRALRHRGWENLRVVLPGEGDLREQLIREDVATDVFHYGWWAHTPGKPRSLRERLEGARSLARFHQYLRRSRPDLVVTNTLVVPWGGLVARFLRIPHVWLVHEFGLREHNVDFLLGRALTLRL